MEQHQPSSTSNNRQAALVLLLFAVALINYFDRQSLSVVAPRLQAELHLGDQGYAHIVSLFLFASTIAYAFAGFISDALGTRVSMAIFVSWWSLAEAATAFTHSVLYLGVARFCLGLGEPGLWVAAPKAVGEFMPKERRGLAVGVYTMGATVGAIVALPAIAMLTRHLPWRSIFLIDGAAGWLWLPLWFWVVRRSKTAKDPLFSAEGASQSSGLRDVLAYSATWKLAVARGLTDSVWYFYLFWFPKYLFSTRNLSLQQMAHIGWIVYLAAGVGTLAGGLASGLLIKRGLRPGAAYRRVMLATACIMPISPLCALLPSAAGSIAIASVVALAHMSWLVTLTATIIELYPSRLMGKAAGLIAAGSGLGGMISSEIIGYCVAHGGYRPVFFAMAPLHPLAIVLLWRTFLQRSPERS